MPPISPDSAHPFDSDVQEIIPGLVVEWLCDKQIVVITNKGGASRTFVDAWIDTVTKIMLSWPATQAFLYLQDLSDKQNVVTPYSRQRAAELYKLRPELTGCVAVVIAQSLTAHLVRLFLRMQKRNLKIELFFSRQGALDWLQQRIASPNT
jgi:hypothetical protein